jgi:hypothetical protein
LSLPQWLIVFWTATRVSSDTWLCSRISRRIWGGTMKQTWGLVQCWVAAMVEWYLEKIFFTANCFGKRLNLIDLIIRELTK